jgi:hypothetical protein
MKRHFEEEGHTPTKAVRCECGKIFHCGTAGTYYFHRFELFVVIRQRYKRTTIDALL